MRRKISLVGVAVIVAVLACGVAVAFAVYETRPEPPTRPVVGKDHWHAAYEVWVCGERQPNFPEWSGGVNSEGDGLIHIHPFSPSEEGKGAALGKFFEYGGGELTDRTMRPPGRSRTSENGDTCPSGAVAQLTVEVNGTRIDDWPGYIPQDGDRIKITFG